MMAALVAEPLANTLGAELSPSAVGQYLNCSAGYWYKHGLGLPDPPSGSMVRGKAVHRVVADFFRAKRDGGALTPFREIWAEESAEAEFLEDENPAAIRDEAGAMALHYIRTVAPSIEPDAIEAPLSGVIGGVKVRGLVDLIDSEGRVIDLKVRKRKPSMVSPDERFQVATYRTLAGLKTDARIDSIVNPQAPELVSIDVAGADADRRMVEVLYPRVQAGIQDGLFFPNRNSNYCSRKHCAFWRACEAEFGGRVK